MLRASLIVPLAVILLLLAGAVVVYRYDASRAGVLPDGVESAGVDLGGMHARDARAALSGKLASLRAPLRVSAGDETFVLGPNRAGVEVDLKGVVARAIAAGREGNVLTRSWRSLTNGEPGLDLEPRIAYSRSTVRSFVQRVARRLERPAVDASVEPSADGLQRISSRDGRALEVRKLERAVTSALTTPGANRLVQAGVEPVQPEITTAEVAERYPHYITIDRSSRRLHYYRDLEPEETYVIAVGRAGSETPAGLYDVQNKAVDPAWSAPEWAGELAGQIVPGGASNNPLKARWLGVYDGAGIHGTDDLASLGTAASRGCIRMSIPEVKELYATVPTGTPVFIS